MVQSLIWHVRATLASAVGRARRGSSRFISAAGFVASLGLIGNLARADEPTTAVASPTGAVSADIAKAMAAAAKRQKFADFNETIKDAKKHEGLFTLYEKEGTLYAEIKPNQYNQLLIAPMAIARGMASAGTPLNFGDEWILFFRRVDDRVQLLRKNIHYEAPKGTPLEKAVQQNFTDSVLLSIPIVSVNPGTQGALIDLANIFFIDFAQLGLGGIDRSRTSWHKVKTFPNNIELQVEATFSSRFGPYSSFGDDGVIDSRGVTLILHYSLAKRPEPGYKPRFADQRIGHFISATKDFGSSDPNTTFMRRINRWRIEKANPSADLSPPKQQLVWWVEDTVPHEYRPFVEDGILEWNKAFEKIGIRNAIGVRWQSERDEFDPEDINYCTFRWITTPYTFAMSGLRADPITGEMIDGDVIFDASWIRIWKNEYALLVGGPAAAGSEAVPTLLDVGEIISPMMAIKNGYGLPTRSQHQHDHDHASLGVIPASQGPLRAMLNRRLAGGKFSACQCAVGKINEYRIAALALAAQSTAEGEKKDESKDFKIPDELIGQAIKEVVMHEVGHSLGLRHNFKASAMLSPEQINDTEITRKKGMVGSVMDYNPLNISRKGQKQGDFATTTIGPYDYWAIEYAYKPISGDEKKELSEIASRSPNPDLVYATDEDLSTSSDPMVNAYDLSNEPLAFAKDRIALAADLFKTIDDTVVRDGESWIRLRTAFMALIGQYGDAAYMSANYIGGQNFARDFKGTKDSRDPIIPVSGAKQREALDFLVNEILADKAFKFSPELLRRLTTEHWYHWGSNSFASGPAGPNIYDYVLRIQQIVTSHCLSADVLQRLQNQTLMVDANEKPLEMADVFRTLTSSIWSEIAKAAEGQSDKVECSTIRRNLQKDYLARLVRMVIGNQPRTYGDSFGYIVFLGGADYPADARSLARMHLKEIKDQIDKVLQNGQLQIEDTTRAHLQESADRIDKVLNAEVESNRP
jgi:hypothetical protein